MATATSRRRRVTAVAIVGALAVALVAAVALSATMAAGRSARRAHRAVAPAAGGGTRHDTFAWLTPQPPPAGWRIARLPSGAAALTYPPGWRQIATDAGTTSVALRRASGLIEGYLNVTPRSGAETLANWTRFRPHHVAEEGAHDVRLLAAAQDVGFAGAHGSCVVDSYTTSRTSYREIACIVRGADATNVVVAAAQTDAWAKQAPLLERAVTSFAG